LVAFHVPDVNVETLVNDELITVEFNVVPVSVPAAAVTVMFAVPSKETPFIVRAVCKAVAVEALPVNAPINDVDVTLVKPAKVVDEAPNDIAVVPIVTVLLAKAEFAIAVKPTPIVPEVNVPTVVILL
jgi:hypothetical protein